MALGWSYDLDRNVGQEWKVNEMMGNKGPNTQKLNAKPLYTMPNITESCEQDDSTYIQMNNVKQ